MRGMITTCGEQKAAGFERIESPMLAVALTMEGPAGAGRRTNGWVRCRR